MGCGLVADNFPLKNGCNRTESGETIINLCFLDATALSARNHLLLSKRWRSVGRF